jgi:phage gpG-like protein
MSLRIWLATDAQKLIGDFEEASRESREGMRLAMFRAMSILKSQIQQNIRTESGLNVRTGTLLNSITSSIINSGYSIQGNIGPSNVPYAAIHEYGGEIRGRFHKPRLKQALKWSGPGGTFFSKGHWIPAYKVPARPYLRPAIEKHAESIAEKFAIFMTEPLGEEN